MPSSRIVPLDPDPEPILKPASAGVCTPSAHIVTEPSVPTPALAELIPPLCDQLILFIVALVASKFVAIPEAIITAPVECISPETSRAYVAGVLFTPIRLLVTSTTHVPSVDTWAKLSTVKVVTVAVDKVVAPVTLRVVLAVTAPIRDEAPVAVSVPPAVIFSVATICPPTVKLSVTCKSS